MTCTPYDWKARLDEFYRSKRSHACPPPVIGITANYGEGTAKIAEGYYKSVAAAGGVPVIVPPVADEAAIISTLNNIDALVLSGGGDYNPMYAGEEPIPELHTINPERDLPELLITRLAYNRQLPMLGICRGIQTLAMALGGRVAQDIDAERREKGLPPTQVIHDQDADRSVCTHTVNIVGGTLLSRIYDGETSMMVNSFHHQAVADTGRRFRVSATSQDGVIEAMESAEHKPILGVQWHPECYADGMPLFRWIVEEAVLFRRAKALHDKIITLDSHCDTPMFFPQGVNFACRDPKLLVDLHKMTEGHQDATIMVAYIPQAMEGNPMAYANGIFDKIETIVKENADNLALARTPSDLLLNKHEGKKSIMLGIENGKALGGDIRQVRSFANRGVTYITLCHNGDNDICDSARGNATHGGVSPFGEQVIREMNACHLMVDLSHAAESSFYDALTISATPIVCSHSSCRALCDHPRNLTDEQMRTLARAGGVMQITLYGGFLSKTEATVLDALEHLKHAIDIMGVDSVGIGTDFDGDGGVPGFADSSEVIRFTCHLLSRRYSDEDIGKIWGGNFLRVMKTVQRL